MSNRAPNAVSDPVFRATLPSTPSSTSATDARTMTHQSVPVCSPGQPGTRAASGNTRVDRSRVSLLAAPIPSARRPARGSSGCDGAPPPDRVDGA